VKTALEEEKDLPTELRKNKDEYIKKLKMKDSHSLAVRSHIDNEYELAKYRDPKLLVTTSREPS